MSAKQNKKALLILLGAACFGSSGTIQALAPQGATPFVIGALRMLVGGISLFIWCSFTGKIKNAIKPETKYLLISALALVGFQLCFFSGVQKVGVAVGTVIAIGFSPIATAVLAALIYKETPPKIWYIATGIALLGLMLLNIDATKHTEFKYMLLPLGAGFSYACYFIFSKPLGKKNAPDFIMMSICLLSGMLLLPVFFIYPVEWIFTVKGIFTSLALGIVTTAMAFSFVLAGLKYTNATNAATLSLAEPMVATCLGIFFLNESITLNSLFGIFCIFLGVFISGYSTSRGK